MTKGSHKGSSFERDFAKRLSLWYTKGERDDVFWRTSNSGGRAKARSKVGQHTHGQFGDIGATDPIGEPLLKIVTFELKRGYNKSTIHDVLDKEDTHKDQQFELWIEKAAGDAKLAGSQMWALVTKRDRRKEMIWWSNEHPKLAPPQIMLMTQYGWICGAFLEDFFEIADPGKYK